MEKSILCAVFSSQYRTVLTGLDIRGFLVFELTSSYAREGSRSIYCSAYWGSSAWVMHCHCIFYIAYNTNALYWQSCSVVLDTLKLIIHHLIRKTPKFY
jgi:hypothetical protein